MYNLFISIIIPCRNEENFIGKCLDSIIAQDYPKDKFEVLVVDGISEDKTREIIQRYSEKYRFIKLLDNTKRVTPVAMNIGVKNATGEVIIIMGSHASYKNDYLSKCVTYLKEYNVDVVGGICVTLPGSDTLIAKSIAFTLSSPFGVGNAYFRIGSKKTRYVDTVPFGCYKREIFNKIGLFDESLIRNQDDEFNLRLIKNSYKILLVPEIVSYYYARDSLAKLWKMYFQYGYFKPLVAKKVGTVLTIRQLIPTIFVCSIISCGIFSFIFNTFLWIFIFISMVYSITNLLFSLSIVLKKGLIFLPFLLISFVVLHFSYGLGYLKGILDFIILNKYKRKKIKDISLTR